MQKKQRKGSTATLNHSAPSGKKACGNPFGNPKPPLFETTRSLDIQHLPLTAYTSIEPMRNPSATRPLTAAKSNADPKQPPHPTNTAQGKPKRRRVLKPAGAPVSSHPALAGDTGLPEATLDPNARPSARGPQQPPQAAPPTFWQTRVRVVLVETGDSLNIGAAARAMSNLGFKDLHLVAPPRFDANLAARSACWAAEMATQAPQHATLPQALDDVDMVVGFTSRHGRNRTSHLMLNEWLQMMQRHPPQKTALLFGSEDHGLLQSHLDCCHYLVRIPSVVQNPAFNLAQSVLLGLFSLCQHLPGEDTRGVAGLAVQSGVAAKEPSHLPSTQRATMADYQQLDQLVMEALQHSQFIHKGTPSPVPGIIRRMLRRLQPNLREMGLLLGMFGKITRALAGRIPCVPLPTTKVDLQTKPAVGRAESTPKGAK